MYIAHKREIDKEIQTINSHSLGVVKQAEKFASRLNFENIVMIAALLHDAGKMNDNFYAVHRPLWRAWIEMHTTMNSTRRRHRRKKGYFSDDVTLDVIYVFRNSKCEIGFCECSLSYYEKAITAALNCTKAPKNSCLHCAFIQKSHNSVIL